ncbi:hypothetical protein T4C_13639 [Trichinella pseudospiralis]|uniref:Uncharacterized protein n=1 Tax=Trichinella pseudospiralis TaxID=6337 RepID=A0A0V1GNZ6_TRIPS|nr:hypothetical protein T4C_1037 [Trichinella pseudospiralis]KRZ01311.1 hypothetical protein T4C_4153 [Trichinella pseudospiralis]KRZ01338.1 hypothetical protein T4C_13639 [Trichinella pseudospiralis]
MLVTCTMQNHSSFHLVRVFTGALFGLQYCRASVLTRPVPFPPSTRARVLSAVLPLATAVNDFWFELWLSPARTKSINDCCVIETYFLQEILSQQHCVIICGSNPLFLGITT